MRWFHSVILKYARGIFVMLGYIYCDSSSNNVTHKRRNSSLCLLDQFAALLLLLHVSVASNLHALLRIRMIKLA